MIPNELNITIEKALQMNPELRGMYESDENVRTLIDMSKRLEDCHGILLCMQRAL